MRGALRGLSRLTVGLRWLSLRAASCPSGVRESMRALALGHPALDESRDGASAAALRAIGALVRARASGRALVAMLTKLCR